MASSHEAIFRFRCVVGGGSAHSQNICFQGSTKYLTLSLPNALQAGFSETSTHESRKHAPAPHHTAIRYAQDPIQNQTNRDEMRKQKQTAITIYRPSAIQRGWRGAKRVMMATDSPQINGSISVLVRRHVLPTHQGSTYQLCAHPLPTTNHPPPFPRPRKTNTLPMRLFRPFLRIYLSLCADELSGMM